MNKRIFIIISCITIALITFYLIMIDSLPPRTPQKIARIVSGLSIPRDADILEFKDEWSSFNGNGFTFCVLRLDSKSFNRIYQESKSLRFEALPLNDSIYGPLRVFSDGKLSGLYKIEIDEKNSMSFSGTIICKESNTIAVYVAVN